MKDKKPLRPSLNISKKKHPLGKPEEINLFNLNINVSPSYLSMVGFTKDGGLGFGNDKINDITLFFENNQIDGWLHLDKYSAINLFKALQKILTKNKKGYCKLTYAGFNIVDKGKTRKL